MKNQQFYSAKQILEMYQITAQTLYNWRNSNKIDFKKLPSGSYVYLPLIGSTSNKKNVLYARVSNTKQKDDLIRQIQLLRQYMVSKGIKVDEEFTDIASGMNEDRKNFNKLLKECLEGSIDTIFITYKDRLTRFGFGYFESILKELGTNIEVVNATKEEDFQQELIQDFVSVIHHFSMKMYSNRRKILNNTKKLLQND